MLLQYWKRFDFTDTSRYSPCFKSIQKYEETPTPVKYCSNIYWKRFDFTDHWSIKKHQNIASILETTSLHRSLKCEVWRNINPGKILLHHILKTTYIHRSFREHAKYEEKILLQFWKRLHFTDHWSMKYEETPTPVKYCSNIYWKRLDRIVNFDRILGYKFVIYFPDLAVNCSRTEKNPASKTDTQTSPTDILVNWHLCIDISVWIARYSYQNNFRKVSIREDSKDLL